MLPVVKHLYHPRKIPYQHNRNDLRIFAVEYRALPANPRMFRLSALTRRLTAATFLVAFLSMFAGRCFCGPIGSEVKAPKMTCCAKMAGKHCQGVAQAKHAPDTDKSDCQTPVKAFFAALAGPPTHDVSVDAPLWLALPPTFDFTFARYVRWEQARPVALVPRRHLKPKIPDIRVFTHSLTI